MLSNPIKPTDWPSLPELVKNRNLDEKAFTDDQDIKLEDPIDKHVAWAFKHIYSRRYPAPHDNKNSKIARLFHGIQHVTRAASYVPVIANLYRRYDETIKLEEKDIKLLQIAVLFHDAARLNEGTDLWDKESGALLYHYLTTVLKVDKEKAQQLADAVANKDAAPPRNIYQKIIHDADCLEIRRARRDFDASHLDFYQDIAKNNEQALEEMAQLITEVESVIDVQGDGFHEIREPIKLKFETEDAYQAIKKTMIKEKEEKKEEDNLAPADPRDYYQIIPKLFEWLPQEQLKGELLDSKRTKPLTLYRCVTNPSAIRKKEYKKASPDEKRIIRPDESMAGLEVYKALRVLGTASRTLKENRFEKDANPHRSTSTKKLAGDCGYYDDNPVIDDISEIHSTDANTGYHKKKIQAEKKVQPLTKEQKQERFKVLEREHKMGGKSEQFGQTVAWQNEIIYHIRKNTFKGVFYTFDPNYFNKHHLVTSYYPFHRFAPPLKAIFLQKEYKKQTGIDLEIKEHSALHNYSIKKQFSEEEILTMWVQMCSDYIEQELAENNDVIICSDTIEMIKTKSMYKTIEPKSAYVKCNASADSNYEPIFRKKIDDAVDAIHKKMISKREEKIKNQLIECKEDILFSEEPIYGYLLAYPKLLENKCIAEKVKTFLRAVPVDAIKLPSYVGDSVDCQESRIYRLSLKMKEKSIAKSIQDKVLTLLIEDIKPEELSRYSIERIVKLYNEFDLEKEIKPLLSKGIKDHFFRLKGFYFHNVLYLITEANKYQLLDKECAKQVAKLMLNLRNQEFDFDEMRYFLAIAQELNQLAEVVPVNIQKEVLRNFCSYGKSISPRFSGGFDDIIPVFINDESLFTLVINKLSVGGYDTWLDYIDRIFAEYLEKNAFTPWQEKIVQKAQAEKLIETINKWEFTDFILGSFEEFIKQAKHFIVMYNDVFQRLVERIFKYFEKSKTPGIVYYTHETFLEVNQRLDYLEKEMPDKKFNEEQLKFIQSLQRQTVVEEKHLNGRPLIQTPTILKVEEPIGEKKLEEKNPQLPREQCKEKQKSNKRPCVKKPTVLETGFFGMLYPFFSIRQKLEETNQKSLIRRQKSEF